MSEDVPVGCRREFDAHNNENEVTGGLTVFAFANHGTLDKARVAARHKSLAACSDSSADVD